MVVYLITNKENNKKYIGQTIGTLDRRWKRHVADSLSNRSDTKFSRAIRKYGKDSFKVEVIYETENKDELDTVEKEMIKKYNSILEGYNSCDGGSDCNTYRYKNKDEMDVIKKSISIAKVGSKNPNARSIKCKNIKSNKDFYFECVEDFRKFLGLTTHTSITRRLRKQAKEVLLGEWIIAYSDEDYPKEYNVNKTEKSGIKVQVISPTGDIIYSFPSIRAAGRKLNIDRRLIKDGLVLDNKNLIKIINNNK